MKSYFLHLKCVKTRLQAFTILKICQGYTPGPPLKEGVIDQLCYCASNN
jgi:hypothetical protein